MSFRSAIEKSISQYIEKNRQYEKYYNEKHWVILEIYQWQQRGQEGQQPRDNSRYDNNS